MTGGAATGSGPFRRLVLASHNPGKLREFDAFFRPHGIQIVGAAELDLVEPEETGRTFVDNARLKAHAAARVAREPCLADDSGLEALGLDGAPGVLSARWAGPEKDFQKAMAAVRDRLIERYGSFQAANRRARFTAVLCLAWPDGAEEIARGHVAGLLVDPPRGQGGFGYDPMFQPDGHELTFGEMPDEQKRALSHRARALEALAERLGFGPRA